MTVFKRLCATMRLGFPVRVPLAVNSPARIIQHEGTKKTKSTKKKFKYNELRLIRRPRVPRVAQITK